MADDRTRWLNRATADRLLRGEPVDQPEDPRARVDAARLRDALDSLLPDAGASRTAELPGEVAALAAFRAARPTAVAAPAPAFERSAAERGTDGSPAEEPLVAIVPVPATAGAAAQGRAPRPAAPWRFGLAAAMAAIAIGGVAAAASGGLFDRALHLNADPAPTAEITDRVTPDPVGGTAGPSTGPSRRPPAQTTGEPFGSPGARTPGPEAHTPPGATGAAAGGTNSGGSGGTGATTGPDKDSREHFGLGETHDRDVQRGVADLCHDFRSGSLSGERENRLNLLAKGRGRVQSYCDELLDGASGTTDSPPKGTTPPVPGPGSGPGPSPAPGSVTGSLGLRLRR
ncbi:hypothetical protein [Streptomyces sp. G-G2]|uniref:hypothetical protein n=1 Tax=Streptomyces sp. G-G2 TaxID=3046201 RepID=UPI0024BB9285|nr:hypothetical protein [Streptomyces sp. G-G2]MDJ0382856.1 hypothetical protein [Streptomyces sp. G-G2]